MVLDTFAQQGLSEEVGVSSTPLAQDNAGKATTALHRVTFRHNWSAEVRQCFALVDLAYLLQ